MTVRTLLDGKVFKERRHMWPVLIKRRTISRWCAADTNYRQIVYGQPLCPPLDCPTSNHQNFVTCTLQVWLRYHMKLQWMYTFLPYQYLKNDNIDLSPLLWERFTYMYTLIQEYREGGYRWQIVYLCGAHLRPLTCSAYFTWAEECCYNSYPFSFT